MAFDAAVALRMITNNRLRAMHRCDFRDLGGALAVTSDTPFPALNALTAFNTDERHIESVLDLGFALLRAFDCPPAADVTPLDRPPSIAARLEARGLRPSGTLSWMVFRGDISAIRTNAEVMIARGWVLMTSSTGCLTTAFCCLTRVKCGVSSTESRT